ncbi:MAG: HlyD family efflux transporter periplasmic adaptor subunit [Gemmiger sp.]|nr:HlyD family efflux transporter periplasmic adaptor subunit [Gemmiger sp.]
MAKAPHSNPKQNQEKKKGRKFPSIAAITVTLLVAAFGYVGIQLYAIIGHTYQTETAIAYTMADSITLEGVAVFDAVDVPGSGNLGYLVEDGERVTAGTVLAEEYTSDAQGTLREQLAGLEKSITLLNKSQNSAGSELSVLTSQSTSTLYDLLDQIDLGDYSAVDGGEQDFLLAQNRLQISTGQVSDFTQTIASLQSQYDAIKGQLGALATVTAETNGYFISAANAGYLSLDSETLASLSPADFAMLLAGGLTTQPENLAGRIITGFTWRFYASCTADEAARFDGVTSVKIRVPGKQNAALTATVSNVEIDTENDVARITLDCQSINAEVLSLGQEKAQIDLQSYTGIRIDRAALHIVDGSKGVYVKYGTLQRFRKISILYENENYILVPAGGAVGTDNEVRLYDEVIVEGINLQDRKLL